jgi:hypothetical protein
MSLCISVQVGTTLCTLLDVRKDHRGISTASSHPSESLVGLVGRGSCVVLEGSPADWIGTRVPSAARLRNRRTGTVDLAPISGFHPDDIV